MIACLAPGCTRPIDVRGLCRQHYEHWYGAHNRGYSTWLDPYILPAPRPGTNYRHHHPTLCTCTNPEPHYLPAFDDPNHPNHHGYYCTRCGRPPLDALHPATTQHLLQPTTSNTETNTQ